SFSSSTELKEEKAELNEERVALEANKAELEENRAELEAMVIKKQGQIRRMSESQAKAQLMIERQKQLTDSLRFQSALDSLQLAFAQKDLQQTEMALKEQETETQLRQSQRNFLFALAAIVGIVAIGLFLRFLGMRSHARVLEEKNKIIKEEKERSEDLLLNILPVAIANELKENGEAKTRRYEQVSVLFADFKGFSKISRELSSEDLISELDTCFRAFDRIIQKYRLEKIKTIGDAYMCAGGLPAPDNGSPVEVVRAALEMQEFLTTLKLERVEKGLPYFEARIGIHTGPIIAGVVGLKKFAFDIWGDTVNVASRMESGGTPGKVNISGTTYEMIKEDFECEYRGKVPAKHIGEVDMYFVGESAA
ncbi:MAG: adenylate/guanylate cyclase domain-containing protein, partial [Bacteroidota bacterium]